MGAEFRLDGKTALVTGASSGLGVRFARTLLDHGASVVLAARRTGALESVAQALNAPGRVSMAELDVCDATSIESLFASLTRIDIVVNNAGVVREAPALEQTEADWDAVVDTNLKGMFLVARRAAASMKTTGGVIINIASVLGLRQAGGVLPYAVSKAGVVQMTKTLALEWARYGIRVNALAPGYIETELNAQFWRSDAGQSLIKRIPQRRLGRLEDLDGPLVLLACDASRYMTGTVLAVDGGHLVSSL